jgi:hypothetical protein
VFSEEKVDMRSNADEKDCKYAPGLEGSEEGGGGIKVGGLGRGAGTKKRDGALADLGGRSKLSRICA